MQKGENSNDTFGHCKYCCHREDSTGVGKSKTCLTLKLIRRGLIVGHQVMQLAVVEKLRSSDGA